MQNLRPIRANNGRGERPLLCTGVVLYKWMDGLGVCFVITVVWVFVVKVDWPTINGIEMDGEMSAHVSCQFLCCVCGGRESFQAGTLTN